MIAPTLTETLSPDPTSMAGCEAYSDEVEFEQAKVFRGYVEAVIDKLNNCFKVEDVAYALENSEWFSGFTELVDLDGDGKLELTVAGSVTLDDGNHVIHLITFYVDDGVWKRSKFFEGGFFGSPILMGIRDVDGDDQSEIIVNLGYGGSWCEDYISVIGWGEDRPYDLFGFAGGFLDCPTEIQIVDLDGDGLMEFVQCPREIGCRDELPASAIVFKIEELHSGLQIYKKAQLP